MFEPLEREISIESMPLFGKVRTHVNAKRGNHPIDLDAAPMRFLACQTDFRENIGQSAALRRHRVHEMTDRRSISPSENTFFARMTRTALFAPFEIIEGARDRGLLLVADHAKRNLPDEYGDLGLPPEEFQRHIAYDIGVETVTRRLAALTGAPAVLANFSRLLIDPNRGEDDPTLIRQLYDGTIVSANYPLAAEERERRLELFYRPYQDAVAAMTASVAATSGGAPFILSVHSFTPVMQGHIRPWHVGVLWDRDDRAPRLLIDMLKADATLTVGDNEPYDGALRGDTMYTHAIVNGFAHALIEIRQDLIAEDAGAEAWAERLAPIVDAINARPDIHEVRQYGSRTGPL